ncbi:hypothetical protein ABW20_dc0110315 [Dactylellina cionopaga]|nr:hypothetical protein ABW20_dc0110315 [Dactylellina cionopaga]
MTIEAPGPFVLDDAMKNGVVINLYKRINDLRGSLETQTSEAQKMTTQLDEIKNWVKTSHGKLNRAVAHMKNAQADLEEVQKSFTVIDQVLGMKDDGTDPVAAEVKTTNENPALFPATQAQDQFEPQTSVNDGPTVETSVSVYSSVPISPKIVAKYKRLDIPNVDPADLYHFNPPTVSKKNPAEQIQKAARALKNQSKQLSSTFGADDQAVLAIYQNRIASRIATPLASSTPLESSVYTRSDRSSVTVKPTKPTPKPLVVVPQALQNALAQQTIENTRVPSLEPPSAPILGPPYTRLPPNFAHTGNTPGEAGPVYPSSQICDKNSYAPEKVPVLRLQDIPKDVSIDDIMTSLAGGPLYKIAINNGQPSDTVRDIRLIYLHRKHALAILNFARDNNGLAIKNCPNCIQLLDDFKENESILSYSAFRKIMLENVTRMVYVQGLDRKFWCLEKFRDLIVAACDKLRSEEPRKFPYKEPISATTDVISIKLGMGDSGLEALVGTRSISLAILVRAALHGLKHPEGFYHERCQGGIGPPISPYDDPATIPTVKAFWMRDPCDAPLDKLPKFRLP